MCKLALPIILLKKINPNMNATNGIRGQHLNFGLIFLKGSLEINSVTLYQVLYDFDFVQYFHDMSYTFLNMFIICVNELIFQFSQFRA